MAFVTTTAERDCEGFDELPIAHFLNFLSGLKAIIYSIQLAPSAEFTLEQSEGLRAGSTG